MVIFFMSGLSRRIFFPAGRILSPAQPERTGREVVEILLVHLGEVAVIGR